MSLSTEENSILNHLASIPKYGNATATSSQVRAIMLSTGGWIMACGNLYDIKTKRLGGGVYRLSLEKR